MLTTTWLAVAFSFAATIFWLASICCCSGRSGVDRNTRTKYERVESPYLGQSGNVHKGGSVPLAGGVGLAPERAGKSFAYEPYRHENV